MLLYLAGDLLREDVAVDVRIDGGEDQALWSPSGSSAWSYCYAGRDRGCSGEGRPPGIRGIKPRWSGR